MRVCILTILIILLPVIMISAQETGISTDTSVWKVVYVENMRLDSKAKDQLKQKLQATEGMGFTIDDIAKKMESTKRYYSLYTDNKVSLFEFDSTVVSSGGREGTSSKDYLKYHTDLKGGVCFLENDFTNTVTMDSTIRKWDFRPMEGMFDISGYKCMKAVAVKDGVTITAYLTSQAGVFGGPVDCSSIPWLVVRLEDGNSTLTLSSLEKVELGKPLSLPEFEGVVSKEEEHEMVKEKLKGKKWK